MAAAPRRKRKTTVVVPATASASLPSAENRPLFRMENFDDGSVRPVRAETHEERSRTQAMADFYGVAPGLSVKTNLRSMDSILAELVSRLNIQEAELAPELLHDAWKKSVGEFLATQSQLVSISRHMAVVRTSHPAVRFELQRLRPTIIRALNDALGVGRVTSVRISHG